MKRNRFATLPPPPGYAKLVAHTRKDCGACDGLGLVFLAESECECRECFGRGKVRSYDASAA